MRWVSEAKQRLRSVLFRSREEVEMDEEMEFHLEMQTREFLLQGMSPEEARRRARLTFGGIETHREEVRAARGLGKLETLARDARYAIRGLRLNPVFTATLVLTLALGVGATGAMFSVVDSLLLRPLPYDDPDRLVQVETVNPRGGSMPYLAWDVARVWRKQEGVFEVAVAHLRRSALFTGGAEPRMLTVEGVTPEFEEVLGVQPFLGRGLYEEDADPGAPPVAVLSHGFWRSAFGSDPGAVGKWVDLEGRPHRIVGVFPRGFKFPEYATTELWIPIRSDGTFLGEPAQGLSLLGRTSGEPLEVLQARADAAAQTLAEQQPRERGWSIRMEPLDARRAGNPQVREPIWFLTGAVFLLLLVAAINATSLLLMRGWSRSRELATRRALGASRSRIVTQLMVESVVLAVLSGAAASVLAFLAVRALRGMLPESITFFAPHAIELEWRTLAFTLAIAVVAGTIAGIVPAVRAARTSPTAARGRLTPYAAGTSAAGRLRSALVVGEVSISVVLLVGAGLLIHSFVRLVSVDPGFRMENLAVMRLNLAEASYPTPGARAEFLHRLERRLEAIPGVDGVAVNGGVPLAGGFSFGTRLRAEGAEPPADQPQLLPFASVPPDFFEVLDVSVVAGRALTAADAGTDHVVIDRTLARFLWGSADPVGRRFRVGDESGWLTVVGVAPELRMMGPDDRQARFGILYPLGSDAPSYVPLAIRTRGDPRSLLPAFRAAVHELDPRQPVEEVRSASELYAETVEMPRFLLVLMSILAGLALALAAVGIYGVLALGVLQRRRELGIRIALGAPLARISGEIVREGLLLAGIGAAAGAAGALLLSRSIRGLLYGVHPTDPATIVAVVALTLAAATAACYLPARRATRVDVVEMLRIE